MKITKFKESDAEEMVSLFYETVHAVNSRDYSQEQLDAWAPRNEKEAKMKSWKESLSHHITFVAKVNDKVVGFSDLKQNGYLDRLYVHKDYQGQGIATALIDRIESEAKKLNFIKIDVEASLTAKAFFEQRGYNIVRIQTVKRNGVEMTNIKMLKVIK